ncbi:TPA_asm: G [Bemisia tabaci-associated virus 1]|uniref:G n=1 Tax=Bemisia tabaci-associated virus 1 TaxID=3070198 RepID=A0A8D9UJ23_9RHAB|nr:G [Bemisia tabaci-associated virus 1] [Bemisia tabaci-associated virus 1]DAF42319.1 TPA_asm: G [Bemisia tabaci-associated virus 1]
MIIPLILLSCLSHLFVRKVERYIQSWVDPVVIMVLHIIVAIKEGSKKIARFFQDRGNRLFYLYLTIVVHLLLIKIAYAEEIEVAMPYYCPKKMPLDWMTPSSCYRSCNIDGLSTTAVNLTIQQHDVKQAIGILECQKWVTTVTSTETWTFSKLQPKEEDVSVLVQANECWTQFDKICKSSECETTRPTFQAEYAYAADTVKQYTWFQLRYKTVTVPISYDDDSFLRLEGQNFDYSSGQATSPLNEKKLLLWKVKDSVECRSVPVATIQCNQILDTDGTVTSYICGGGRLIVTAGKELSSRHCSYKPPAYISEEGIIYSKGSAAGLVKDGLPLFKESLLPAMKEIVLQQRVHSILMQEQLCKHSCLSPFPTSNDTIFFYGNKRVAKHNDNEYLSCIEDLTCSLIKPLLLCSESNLVAVSCSGISTWWDPSLLYVNPYHYCTGQPIEKAKIRFSAHGGIYQANSTGIYYEGGEEVRHQVDPPRLERNLVLLGKDEVRRALLISTGTVKPDTELQNQKIHRNNWDFGIISFLSNIEHEIKVWVVLVISGLVAVCAFFLILPKFGARRSKGDYHNVSYALREF